MDLSKPDHEQFHFFASSVAEWKTTTAERDLRALLRAMDKGRYTYNLFYVPKPSSAHYPIANYAPVVKGAKYLGQFKPKKK